MKILAIDTSTEACSVALWNDGITYTNFELCNRQHNQRILPMIKTTLDQSNINLKELNAVAFSCGPGNFTSIRIGTCVAKGIALSAELPIISISTLVTIAQSAWRKTGATQVLAAIDARMGEVYWAEYIRNKKDLWYCKNGEVLLNHRLISEQLKRLSGEWTTVGTGWQIWPTITYGCNIKLKSSNILLPNAEDMLPIACRLLTDGKISSAEEVEPIYLRNKVT